jgi:hypothetical protein
MTIFSGRGEISLRPFPLSEVRLPKSFHCFFPGSIHNNFRTGVFDEQELDGTPAPVRETSLGE